VVDVGGDDHSATRNFRADELGIEVLPLGYELHLIGDDALAGGFELGHAENSFS
jgi:hypothetical protein